ncbi:hypothetical protein ACH4NO_18195 [Streptomyces olivaceus]|uniref:hypothetical protein n=1 Tax=Streptomyces olivaceus TaxID=47716 RepID=UPI0037BDF024
MPAPTRILTQAAALTGDRNATVDIEDGPRRSVATCRGCQWSRDHGVEYRTVLTGWAQEHADQCTAIPA